jgi:KUP system potassium uptake protein
MTYMGQGSYLLAHPESFDDPFWHHIPKPVFIPMLVIATLAAVVGSQALITGVFSIMGQAMMLGVLPRLAVKHTDKNVEGQIYIPQVSLVRGHPTRHQYFQLGGTRCSDRTLLQRNKFTAPPQINWILLVGCILMVVGFQDTEAMGHAYGVAVITVMFITSIFTSIAMLVCFDINPILVALFTLFFGEGLALHPFTPSTLQISAFL